MEQLLSLETPLVVMGCVLLSWKIVKHIWSFLDVGKEPVTVLVTGAAGMSFFISFFLCVVCVCV